MQAVSFLWVVSGSGLRRAAACSCSGVLGRQSAAKEVCSGRSAVVSSLGPCPPPAWAAAAAKEDSTGSSQGPWPPWGRTGTHKPRHAPALSGLHRETRSPEVPTFSINPAQGWAGSRLAGLAASPTSTRFFLMPAQGWSGLLNTNRSRHEVDRVDRAVDATAPAEEDRGQE